MIVSSGYSHVKIGYMSPGDDQIASVFYLIHMSIWEYDLI